MFFAASLILSVPEVILLLFGAVILGITIHFFITSRKSLKATTREMTEKKSFARDEWKLRYLNDMELREKEITALRHQLLEAEENVTIYSIEAEEVRLQNHKLETQLANVKKEAATVIPIPRANDKFDYLEQLRQAQSSLLEQNQKINQLLGNIDVIREKEEKHREILRDNAELSVQVNHMRMELSEREKEITNIKQKEQLTKEMTSMLDNAYSEFNVLQNKIQKLESQLTSSRMLNLEYEDLKEEHSKMTREFEEHKVKLNAFTNENQQIQMQLMEAEDKLREANFQRQQLQKRVAYLEELNNDLHVVSDANKKLEGQLRRIGELESMLNVVSEERDELVRGQDDDK
jgi:DNA repair exonuclease SbcCD ATPase subunit